MTPEHLDAIEARANAATEGPWERGDVWQWAGVMPEMFGEGRCALCQRHGEPVWAGQHDINGETMHAHKHRNSDPYAYDYWISNEHGLVVGPYDYETGGVIDPADTEFIVHARTDVAALVAEVRRLRATVDAVDKLHEPTGTHLVAEIDGFGGEQREIEPDSFEEITSRQIVCMSCAGYPEAPCPTRQAIDEHKEQTA